MYLVGRVGSGLEAARWRGQHRHRLGDGGRLRREEGRGRRGKGERVRRREALTEDCGGRLNDFTRLGPDGD